jgi:hypothetical protein
MFLLKKNLEKSKIRDKWKKNKFKRSKQPKNKRIKFLFSRNKTEL